MRRKLNEWFKRYAAAEFAGLMLTLIFSAISMHLFGNIILSAFIATWADNVGFYGVIAYNDLNQRKKEKKRKLKLADYARQIRNMVVEFGPAEYLNSFAIRPIYLSVLPFFISNYSLAILIGSLLANITYYVPTIISYELRKKHLGD